MSEDNKKTKTSRGRMKNSNLKYSKEEGAGKSNKKSAADQRRNIPPAERKISSLTTAEKMSFRDREREVLEETSLTLQASRRFWIFTLGGLLAIIALVQGYGYFTGWGNPQKVIQRHFSTAQRLTLAKRYEAAINQYKKILKKNPDKDTMHQALIGMADLYFERKDWTQAAELYRRLRTADPGEAMASWAGLKIAESLHKSGNLTQAANIYKEISEKYPRSDWDAEANLGLGKVQASSKQYAAAIKTFEVLEKNYSGGFLAAEALVEMGRCYEQLEKNDKARNSYKKVLEEYPATMNDEARRRLSRLEAGGSLQGVKQWGE